MTDLLFIRMGGEEIVWYVVSSPIFGMICIFGTVFLFSAKLLEMNPNRLRKAS